jgi:hypothetical protein
MLEILRREVPMGLATFVIAFMFFDYYFVPIGGSRALSTLLLDWAVIITATVSGVGVLNVIIRTVHTTKKRVPYWYLDIWVLIVMVIVAGTGLIGPYATHTVFLWLMKNISSPLEASVYAMTCFEMVTAFYRSFRVRSVDAGILLVSAFVMMLRNAPITGSLMPSLLPLGNWLLDVPTNAASRAFLIIASIGLVGFAVRTLLWHEKPSVGVVD